MGLTIDAVQALAGDVLEIVAHDDADNTYIAHGWASATTNHYDDAAYDGDGRLVPGAKPRLMTADETGVYALTRLVDAYPAELGQAAQATPVAFVEPAAAAQLVTPEPLPDPTLEA